MIPSIKTLMRVRNMTTERATQIRRALQSGATLSQIDELLGTYGVEHIARGHNRRSPAISYCNAGDPYTTTIMRVNGRFVVGCWGDIVERGHYD